MKKRLPPVVVELASLTGTDTASMMGEVSPMERVIEALETFGPVGATATEWERKCDERAGPKSGQFYRLKEKAVADGTVTANGGRFVIPNADATPTGTVGSEQSAACHILTPPSFH